MLDIDGVLNHQGWYERNGSPHGIKDREKYLLAHLDPEICGLLQAVLAPLRAEIVISSTWRLGSTLPQLGGLLRRKGLSIPLVGCTPLLGSNPPRVDVGHLWRTIGRGMEIQWWLRKNTKVEEVCLAILDDDSDMGDLKPRLIHCGLRGFEAKQVPDLEAMLRIPLGPHVWAYDALACTQYVEEDSE